MTILTIVLTLTLIGGILYHRKVLSDLQEGINLHKLNTEAVSQKFSDYQFSMIDIEIQRMNSVYYVPRINEIVTYEELRLLGEI